MANGISNEMCNAILASLRKDLESLFLNIELMIRRHGIQGLCSYFIKDTPYILELRVRPKTAYELELEANEHD